MMKTVEEIYAALHGRYSELTGYTPPEGSEISLRFYAYAAQMQALDVHMDWVEAQCFPQSAAGEALTRHAVMRGLSRKGGVRATGQICFGRDEASEQELLIPGGTVCLTENLVRFVTRADGLIPAGERVTYVPSEACEPGVSGNAKAGSIALLSLPPVGVGWCTNIAPFTGGQDEEDDEALRVRLLESFRRLPNGANAAFYVREAMRHPEVAAADVLPRVQGRGTVGVVIATAAGMPPAALMEEVRAALQGIREIATDVFVSAPIACPVDLEVEVAPADGVNTAEACAAAETALRAYFGGQRLGKPLRLSDLQYLLHETPGLSNYRLVSPAADMELTPGQLPQLNALTVRGMPQGG